MAQPPGASSSQPNSPDLARLQAALLQSAGYSAFPSTLQFSPFFPGGGVGQNAFHPGLSGWLGGQNSAAAQMVNLAAMQQAAMLPLLGMSPPNSSAGSITDSFADFLKKMPQAPSLLSPSKERELGRNKAPSHAPKASLKEEKKTEASSDHPSSSLQTLAVVASAIKSYDKTTSSSDSVPVNQTATTYMNSSPLVNPTMDLSSRDHPKEERQRQSRKMSKPEKNDQNQDSGVKRKAPRLSEPSLENDSASLFSGARRGDNIRVDPQLLNASAAAWAALSNQLLFGSLGLGAEGNKSATDLQNGLLASASNASASRRRKSGTRSGRSVESKRGGGSMGRERTQEDKMDETIERVIRDSAPLFPSPLNSGPHPMKEKPPRPSSNKRNRSQRESNNGLTESTEKERSPAPLDLSCKPSSSIYCDSLGEFLPGKESPIAQSRKRRVVEETSVRIPLALGWRRQTCVRNISGNGVRGDVIYYAPCGKKLGSYAEVMRYLSKMKIRGMSREHFSFSCKVLVGEFLLVQPDSFGNGIVTLTEEELLERVAVSGKRSRTKTRTNSDDPTLSSPSPTAPSESPLDLASNSSSVACSRFGSAAFFDEITSQLTSAGSDAPTSFSGGLLIGSTNEINENKPCESVIPKTEGGRTRPLRQPMEDMDIGSDLKMLPTWNGVPNMSLSAPAFADILMVVEFIHNFAHVLKIDVKKDIPTLDEIHKGIVNHPDHVKSFRHLTKLLLILVLEYPGLKSGQGKTLLGQNVRDLRVTKDNQGELLRLFLRSRDETGKQLSTSLEHSCFEYCSPDIKAAILAFMCNELLYCRNVVREIEGNIEDVARLKGDRWLREGKARSLRALQAKKRVMATHVKREITDGEAEPFEGERKGNDIESEENTQCSSGEISTLCDDTSLTVPVVKKAMPPGVGLPEILSEEEEAMSVDELDELVHRLLEEAAELKIKITEVNSRVRTQPLGEDRYHRQYWCLRECESFLVESAESSGLDNPAWNSGLYRSYADETDRFAIEDCVEYLVDSVCLEEEGVKCSASSKLQTPSSSAKMASDGKPKGRWKEIPATYRTGWWEVKTKEELCELIRSLRSKGIRERLLQRALTRIDDVFNFDKKSGLSLSEIDRKPLTSYSVECLSWERVLREIRNLEAKICHANVHCRGYKNGARAISTSDTRSLNPTLERKKCLKNRVFSGDKKKRFQCVEEWKAEAQQRLLSLERAIERRYIKHPFHHEELDPENVVSTSTLNSIEPEEQKNGATQDPSEHESEAAGEDESKSREEDSKADSDGPSVPEVPALLERWREGVTSSETASQLMLAVNQLDENIAWEKSIMKASCQICRSGDNESELLLCDGCDMGFHTYCFKPKMCSIPEGDWFCPSCLSRATDEPCCLICWKTSGALLRCTECDREFHGECLGLPSHPEDPQVLQEGERKKPRNITSFGTSHKTPWACTQCSKNMDLLCNIQDPTKSNEKKAKTKGTGRKPGLSGKKSKIDDTETATNHNEQEVENKESLIRNLKMLLGELECHKDSWPFKLAVDTKSFPLYKKVIKRPMDLSLIQEKIRATQYESAETFATDVELIFENCRVFNEDDSPVGKAGHSLKRFFQRRWKEIFQPTL